MTQHLRPALLLAIALAFPLLASCDEIKDATEMAIQGEAEPLAEEDMPNCSRVVNCCAKLKTYSLTPEDINETCDENFDPAASTLIETYQAARDGIDSDPNIAPANKEAAKEELRLLYQERIEPGCRCFLDQTVGTVSADGFLSPADCEIVEEVGALEPPATCDDATDALLEAVTNPPTVGN